MTANPRPNSQANSQYGHEAIARYYRESQWHYRWLWNSLNTHALHMGYFDDGVRTHGRALHRLNERLADFANISEGDRVLDAGCGIGGTSMWLTKQRDAHCHGITISPNQIDNATARVKSQGLSDHCEFSLRDFLNTGFQDESFDVVIGVESICYAAEKLDFIREAWRVLKPGGRLVLSDGFRAGRPMDPVGEERMLRCFQQWVVPDLDTVGEFENKMAQTGFIDVQFENASEKIMPSARRLWMIGIGSTPFAWLFRLLGIHSKDQHQNWKASIDQYTTLRDKLWIYGLFCAIKPEEF